MKGYVMGKMIHFKSGVEPIHITAVTHASIQCHLGLPLWLS